MTLPGTEQSSIQEPDMSAALELELNRLEGWLMGSKRDTKTQIVTKGAILSPPFQLVADKGSRSYQVTIKGSSGSASFEFNKIVVSPFRKDLGLFVMDTDNVVTERRFIVPLTTSYQKILATFPPNSQFNTEELYAKVRRVDGKQQAHARRRWKELKYDYGFDVDFNDDTQWYWRGPSETPIRDPSPRPDDKKLRKALVPLVVAEHQKHSGNAELTCNYCAVSVRFPIDELPQDVLPIGEETPTEPGLLDHRRPTLQGGTDEAANLQLFCGRCNNKKMTACNKCAYSFRCETCMWAHPELVRDQRLVLILDPDVISGLRSKFGTNLESVIPGILHDLV